MTPAVVVVSALAPGIFWFWVFTKGKSYRPAPRRLMAVTFFLGMLSVIPAGLIESVLIDEDSFMETATIGAFAAAMFFVVGPVEETSKFLAVRLHAFRTPYLQEPLDGMMYGAAASLGFASAENILYASTFGPEVILVRGPLSTLAHLVFGSLWAVTLTRPGGTGAHTRLRTLAGLAMAAALHGMFNVFAFSPWGIAPAVLLVALGIVFVVRSFRLSRIRSRFHLGRNVPELSCNVCGARYRLGDSYCPGCGAPTGGLNSSVTCANCGQFNLRAAHYCAGCGDLFTPHA